MATVCQQWQVWSRALMERVSGESLKSRTQWRLECRRRLWAELISECCPWAGQMAHRQTSTMSHNELVTLSPSLAACPLLVFGSHMSFISIFRDCETFATTECDRFHKLSFTVAQGGRGSAYHLLIVTVPGTSIRGWLSAIAQVLWESCYLYWKWITEALLP